MTAKGKITTANLVAGETRILVNYVPGQPEVLKPATTLKNAVVVRVLSVAYATTYLVGETRLPYIVTTTEGTIRAYGHQTFKLAGDSPTELKAAWFAAHAEAGQRVRLGIDLPAPRHLTEEEIGEGQIETRRPVVLPEPEPTTLAAVEARYAESGSVDDFEAMAAALDSPAVLDELHAEAEREAREETWRAEAQQMEDTGFGSLLEHFSTLLMTSNTGWAALNHLHGQALEEYQTIDQERSWDNEIVSLREEFPGAAEDRRAEIVVRLAQLGTVVYPEGTPEYAEYGANLRAALKEWVRDVDTIIPSAATHNNII